MKYDETDELASLSGMSQDALKAEILTLRKALRTLRDRTGHDLCWYNPEIWDVLPEMEQPHPVVPEWCEFMTQCAEFRASLDAASRRGG